MTLPNGTPVEVASIPFHGGDVLAAQIDDKTHVVLRPAIEMLGLDYSSQLRKLKAKSWACVVNLTMQLPGDTQSRDHAAVDVRTFLMLMATINEKQVADGVRDVLIAYQNEIADVIESYFVDGEAANPRTAHPAPLELTSSPVAVQAEETAAIIRMLGTGVEVGLLDRSWAAGKAQLRVARVMGEAPELPAELTPLYIPDYLKSKGLTAREINSVQSWFGRRAVEMGEANGLDVPALRPTEQTNGSIRETRAWRREHLPLFEMVWDTYYAEKYATPMVLELGAA
ncbi:phage antirepressor N-terminal domain-containing protein [Actinoplanes sp. CA-051413]|uniref:phage antirepressor N-terminal domain-containing protein n=1 Tax=Actinoplanes sp. CA-051413 TaxID=3239899 RepID=UPI003D97677D